MPGILHYLRSFRHLATLPESDGELLQRFRLHRDELAFATLVHRHGPMVLGIARRVLGQSDTTEDVFQATFLVLARRGRHLETWPTVAGWLVQVARRAALQARAKSARRTRHEQQAAAMTTTSTTAEPMHHAQQRDLAELLDAELARLPSKYRTPLVLCQLQGQTKEETARQLGWPVGSVSGRLARGKKLLQDRLLRRGFVPTVVATALTLNRLDAQVPSLLIQATTLLAASVVHQTSKVSASAAVTLAHGVMTSMFLTKLKYATAVLVTIALCLGTGAWALSGKNEPAIANVQPPKIEAKASSLLEQMQGVWEVVKLTDGKDDSTIKKLVGKHYWIFRDHSFSFSTEPFFRENQDLRPFQLDETFAPCHIDWQHEKGVQRSVQKTSGIIRIQDGILTMNLVRDSVRPKTFEPGGGAFTYTLRRASDYDRLEGIWRKEERNPVTEEIESAEELIFRKNMYVRRRFNFNPRFGNRHSDDPPKVFSLNEASTPKQLDMDIKKADLLKRQAHLFNDKSPPGFLKEALENSVNAERTLAIYELKDNDFKYVITGFIPFMFQGNEFVLNLKSPMNKRASSFSSASGKVSSYKRVERSLKENANTRLETPDDPNLKPPNIEPPSTEPKPPSPELQDLRQQRLKIAQERMKLWQQAEAAGKHSTHELGAISQQLLDASLALAADKPAQMKAMEEHLKVLKQVEERAKTRHQAGASTTDDLLAAQLRRIEFEIQFEELKAKR